MKFIKITNYQTSVNRLSLEKLGLSTKRDDPETIGQFGSGIKYAPIAALRKGLRWVFAGSDSKGNYLMEYIVKDDDGIPSIFYKYEDYEKPSSFTPDAGVITWENPFQIVREVIANAIDQAHSSETLWDISIVDESEIKAKDQEFSVYITADDSITDIINNFDYYFTTNRSPIYEKNGVYTGFKVYEKIPSDKTLRVYSKGVLVFCSDDFEDISYDHVGMFDYEFNDIELNEERRIRSEYDMNWRISNILFSFEDEDLITEIINNALLSQDSYYEFDSITQQIYSRNNIHVSDVWIDLIEDRFNKSVIMSPEEATVNAKLSVRGRGYEPLIVGNESKFAFLKKTGVKTVRNILGEEFKYQYTTDIYKYPQLVKAVEIINFVFPETKDAYPSRLGVLTENAHDISGMTLNISKDIEERLVLVRIDEQDNNVHDFLMTLLHEFDHFKTGCVDGDLNGRAFRELADNHLAELCIRYYQIKHGLDENDISWW